MYRRFLLLIGIVFTSNIFCVAQKVTRPEFFWALRYPIAALKARKVSKETLKIAIKYRNENFPKSKLNGDFCDAYKHTLWMYLLSEKIGDKKSRKLGIAHEKGNYLQFKKRRNEDGELPDSIATVMDLWNNDLGLALFKSRVTKENYQQQIIRALENGEGRMILCDEQGNYYTCSGEKIEMKNYFGKWNIPKCLIATKK